MDLYCLAVSGQDIRTATSIALEISSIFEQKLVMISREIPRLVIPKLFKWGLTYKTKLKEKIKEAVEQQSNIYKKDDHERAKFCEDLAQFLSEDFGDFEAKVKEKILTSNEDLQQICFEICGVFRQAKLPLSSLSRAVQARMMVPKVPRDLQNSILR